jgi:Fur family transcriptional regulator, ferric uptake regulator
MVELDESVAAAVAAALAPSGQRLTRHRRAVLAALTASEHPLTAEELVSRSNVPQSTAYRQLAELVDAGVVARVGGVDRVERHELSERFSQRHHHHLVCTRCGAVVDFDASAGLERLIDQELEAVAADRGFTATHHVFDVRGVCADCR